MNKNYNFTYIEDDEIIIGNIIYQQKEFIFNTSDDKKTIEIFSLMIGKGYNDLNISLKEKRVIGLEGFNNKESWIITSLAFPKKYIKGKVYLTNDIKSLMDGQWYIDDWETHYDVNHNIICIGNCNFLKTDIFIEVMSNILLCISDNYLKAIWIKNTTFN